MHLQPRQQAEYEPQRRTLTGALALYLSLMAAQACRVQHRFEREAPIVDAGGARDSAVPPPVSDVDSGVPNMDAAAASDAGEVAASAAGAIVSPIATENMAAGSDTFALAQPARGAELSGYASATSVAPGESLRLFVNVDREQNVRWELYRVGYYQGHGARSIATGEAARVAVQPACPLDASTGMVECRWTSAFEVAIDPAWPSGYYAFKLINEGGADTHVPVIVREAARRAPIVIQASVTTWQAYNTWGGTSLYRNNGRDPSYTADRARRVSFDRPYGDRAAGFMKETQLVRWLEQRGYDASYVTNIDVDQDRNLLEDRKLFVSVLHDEYWTVSERDALQQARDAGVSLAFLSANTGYWRIRLDASSSGVPRRIVTCYKSARIDPLANARETTAQFRQQPYPRPENELLGVMYGDWSDFAGFPFIVTNPRHWIYAGTGVADRDTLNAVIGVEWDSVVDNGLTPQGLEVVGDSPVVTQAGVPFPHAQASVYSPTPHSFVFAAGSIEWISGLDGKRSDTRVQRMTENVFARAGFALLQPTRGAAPMQEDVGDPAEVEVIAGNGEPGFADGTAERARFSSPAGVAAAASGELFVADTGNHVVRKIDAGGRVTTIAGCSPDGVQHSQPCFDNLVGIAVDPQGVVYVSDAVQHTIYSIAADGTVGRFAGTGQAGLRDASDRLAARFSNPRGIALAPDGALYVADFENSAIRRIAADGVTTLASDLLEIMGVAAGADGAVYFTSSGDIKLGVVQNAELRDLADASVKPLEGVSVGPDGVVFADAGNYRVRRIAADGQRVTWLGDGRFGREPTRVVLPRSVAPARAGYAVADSGNHRIVWFKPGS